jgi:L-lysine 6-transaminase
MVRSRRILETYEAEGLVDRARTMGKLLHDALTELATRHDGVTDVRGKGLMCALTLPSREVRDRVLSALTERNVLLLGCGERSVRFRPALTVTTEALDAGVRALDEVLTETL